MVALLAVLTGCKGSGGGTAPESKNQDPNTLPALAIQNGLPVRQFFLHTAFGNGEQRPTGVVFTADVDDGEVVEIGKDALRAQLGVKERDGSLSVVTPRAAVYRDINLVKTPLLRALCATVVTAIDRGPSAKGHAYSYDTSKGSRLTCWVNGASGAKNAWAEIEIASSVDAGEHDMFWSFALSGSRTEPKFDVVYAQDAEWQPGYFHSIGRKDREKGFERTVELASNAPALRDLVDGEFPDFGALQARRFGRGNAICDGRCGWVWDGMSWIDCSANACGGGQVCKKACAPTAARARRSRRPKRAMPTRAGSMPTPAGAHRLRRPLSLHGESMRRCRRLPPLRHAFRTALTRRSALAARRRDGRSVRPLC